MAAQEWDQAASFGIVSIAHQSGRGFERRLETEILEPGGPYRIGLRRLRGLFHLRAVVEGEDAHLGPLPAPVGGPMDVL